MAKNEIEKAFELLKASGDYTKTDLALYTELSAGKIRAALINDDPQYRFPIYNLIELKDTSFSSEVEKRYDTIEGKFFTSNLDKRYTESIEEIILASLDATMWGYGVVEAYLDADAKLCFKRIEKEFFYFREKKLFLKDAKGKEFEPTLPRYMVFKKRAKALKLLWLIFAKHFVLSHYMKFTEFLGVPPIIVNAASSEKPTISAISEAMRRLKSGSYAVLGKEDIAKVLEGKGSQADFMAFVQYVDKEIAKNINGSTLTSNAGTTGSLALGQVHEQNRYEITSKDAKVAGRCIAKAFAVFGINAEVSILVEKDKDLLQRAQVFQIVAGQGYEMSPDQIAEEFDLPKPANNTIINKKALAKNAKTTDLPADQFEAFTPPSKHEEEIKRALNAILKEANSYEEAFDLLVQAFPHFKLESLEKELEKVVTNSMILGSVNEPK